jgi:hypothetical protein
MRAVVIKMRRVNIVEVSFQFFQKKHFSLHRHLSIWDTKKTNGKRRSTTSAASVEPRNSDEVSRAIQAISGFGRNDYDYQAQRHGAW